MNFRHMPELNWFFGYPFALLLMSLISLMLYLVFKHHGWLQSTLRLRLRVRTPP